MVIAKSFKCLREQVPIELGDADNELSLVMRRPIITAAVLSQVGSGKQFSNGRQLSTWCGLVPRQFSSGGKTKLGKITKNGNNELRALLIHGARSVSKYTPERTDALSRWFNALALRSGKTKAIVALANKLTRIAWVIVTTNDEFKASCAFKSA